jgi:hypothetical protein
VGQHGVSTSSRYVKPPALDQLEDWMKENPIPYIYNDKFSQEVIFHYWDGCLSGYGHINQVYPDVVRMWRQFHGCPTSGDGIVRVFFSPGKQNDTLKEKTRDKILENKSKTTINHTKLSNCDDKGVFDDDDTYRKHKHSLR